MLSERPRHEMGAHLHRTLKFLPSATCCRDRLLPMASTRVTMSEPKPEGGWGHAQAKLRRGGQYGNWVDGGRTGFRAASPLSDRSRELTAPASHTKSCITWAPAERSLRWKVGLC